MTASSAPRLRTPAALIAAIEADGGYVTAPRRDAMFRVATSPVTSRTVRVPTGPTPADDVAAVWRRWKRAQRQGVEQTAHRAEYVAARAEFERTHPRPESSPFTPAMLGYARNVASRSAGLR